MRLLPLVMLSLVLLAFVFSEGARAEDAVKGQVLGAGAPIANSTVTLWEASSGAPKQLAQAKTDVDGRFELRSAGTSADTSLYLIATGGEPKSDGADNPAIALLTILGNKAPATVTINEMTTVASVWTNSQFLEGTALKGHALGLKIAAGNVPSFVDLASGGWGTTIQDPLNSSQTPTMANFATLADALAGCVTRVQPNACNSLFAAAKGPAGNTPTDTLTAAESIARYPWYQPQRIFSLVGDLYPVPGGKTMRQVPYMPYLGVPPSAWVIPLKFTGGGYVARQGNVRQRGQSVGWRQLHHRLARSGCTLAGQRDQVRA
jgi:hypothetical protein